MRSSSKVTLGPFPVGPSPQGRTAVAGAVLGGELKVSTGPEAAGWVPRPPSVWLPGDGHQDGAEQGSICVTVTTGLTPLPAQSYVRGSLTNLVWSDKPPRARHGEQQWAVPRLCPHAPAHGLIFPTAHDLHQGLPLSSSGNGDLGALEVAVKWPGCQDSRWLRVGRTGRGGLLSRFFLPHPTGGRFFRLR